MLLSISITIGMCDPCRCELPVIQCWTMQVLPFYWPHEKSLQRAVLQSLQSAEYGLGQSGFTRYNLRVTNQIESDGHLLVSAHALCNVSEGFQC